MPKEMKGGRAHSWFPFSCSRKRETLAGADFARSKAWTKRLREEQAATEIANPMHACPGLVYMRPYKRHRPYMRPIYTTPAEAGTTAAQLVLVLQSKPA